MPVSIQDTTIRDQFEQGVRTFGRLFTRWMDMNEWSHPKMASLAKAALGGVGWLHSSQISGLRHCRLESPGPRTFIAIERLNYYLHRYATTKTLIPNTSSSNSYSNPFVITEDGEPPPLGWWVEVFCGTRIPKDIDLQVADFSQFQAAKYSEAWGSLIRRLMTTAGIDLITELDVTIHRHYPARDAVRLEKLRDVIHNRDVWDPVQFANELPAIALFTGAMGGPADEDSLITELKAQK